MNFFFTLYAWPLEKPIVISEFYDFQLDNPRSTDEVNQVKEFLQKAYIEEYCLKNFIPKGFSQDACQKLMDFTKEIAVNELKDFLSSFSLLNLDDQYAKRFEISSELSTDELLEAISKVWIIARYSKEKENSVIKQSYEDITNEWKNIDKLRKAFNELNQSRPSEILKSFTYLLSLLISNTDYLGQTFLIDGDGYSLAVVGTNKNNLSANFSSSYVAPLRQLRNKESFNKLSWLCFPSAKENLVSMFQLLDRAFQNGHTEKLIYIATLLRTISYEISDEKIKLLLLTSIIELLLTHNPDSGRFNIEDSISKQFNLKAGLLMYRHAQDIEVDKSEKIKTIKDDLKTIYDLRSKVAHGNFAEIKNILKKAQQRLHKPDLSLNYYVLQSYKYLKACIYHYINDPDFIQFLKDG